MATAMCFQRHRLRKARLAAGMSQEQLARVINTSERNIRRWESGSNQPRFESVAALAEATGRDVDFFLTADEPESSDDDEDRPSSSLASSDSLTLDGFLRVRVNQVIREMLADRAVA